MHSDTKGNAQSEKKSNTTFRKASVGSEDYHIKSEFDQTYNLSNRVNILSCSGYYNSI